MADRSPHKSSGAFFVIFFFAIILIVGLIAAAVYFAPSVVPKPNNTPTPSIEPTQDVETVKLTDNYIWSDPIQELKYGNVVWNKITTTRYEGLPSSMNLTEHRTDGCGDDSLTAYLRFEGGLCQVGYWLEDSSGNKYDSQTKLKAAFAPVQTPAEAVSFVVSTQSDLLINTSDIPAGLTAEVDSGYLIQLVRKNTFGCGNHKPTGVIFLVTTTGEISKVAYQVAPTPVPSEPVLCAD